MSEMATYIKITRSDSMDYYVVRFKEALSTVECELDEIVYSATGASITLTPITMSEEEFDGLPEFEGF